MVGSLHFNFLGNTGFPLDPQLEEKQHFVQRGQQQPRYVKSRSLRKLTCGLDGQVDFPLGKKIVLVHYFCKSRQHSNCGFHQLLHEPLFSHFPRRITGVHTTLPHVGSVGSLGSAWIRIRFMPVCPYLFLLVYFPLMCLYVLLIIISC